MLEDKMNIMKEMLQVVASGQDHDQVPEQHNINDSFVAADRLPSLDLPQPDYVSMVGSLVLRMRKPFLCIQLRIYSIPMLPPMVSGERTERGQQFYQGATFECCARSFPVGQLSVLVCAVKPEPLPKCVVGR